MGHDEPFTVAEVAEHFALVDEDGGRAFVLLRDGALAGDADLRGVATGGGAAEFAFMIAAPGEQGRGLGTKFALMVHAFAFRELGLHHVYASIVPDNAASRRVFDKLGYAVDASAPARAFADHPSDIVMSIEKTAFERAHAATLAEVRITRR